MRRLEPLAPVVALALLFAAPPSEAGPRSTAATLTTLQKQRIRRVAFEEVALPGVVKWLRTATGLNFHVKRTTLAKEGVDPEDVVVSLELEDVTVAQVLELILEPHGLAAQVKGNVVYITTHSDAKGKPVTRLYYVAHITWQKVDFIGPNIQLQPSDFHGEEYEPEVLVEDDPLRDADAVADLVREILGPDGWDDDWEMRATARHLVVRAPLSVQRKIPRILDVIASMK